MPIYEYQCTHCHHEFELMRSIHEAEQDATCPRCQSMGQRMASTIAIKMGPYIRPSKKVSLSSPGEGSGAEASGPSQT